MTQSRMDRQAYSPSYAYFVIAVAVLLTIGSICCGYISSSTTMGFVLKSLGFWVLMVPASVVVLCVTRVAG